MINKTKIYVGNLSYNSTQEDISDFFSEYGKIENVHLMIDRDTQRSRGFAFVTFEKEEGAENALESNGKDLQGRALRVNLAHNKEKSGDTRRRRDF